MKVGVNDAKAWTSYSPAINGKIETAYATGKKDVLLVHGARKYTIKFSTMVQFRNDDPSLQRPVRRV